MKNGNFEVRDFRNKQFYMKDDEYLNGYARLCGWKATLVYDSLCRHANREQEAWPSINTMCEELGVSRSVILPGLKTLMEWNIITKEEDKGRNNKYLLLDKSVWKPKPNQSPTDTSHSQILVSDSDRGSHSQILHQSPTVTGVVTDSDTKDIYKGNTYKDTQLRKVETTPTLAENKYLARVEITDNVLEELASKYQVTYEFVMDCWDTAQNWLDSKALTKRDYKAFLSNWIKREKADRIYKARVQKGGRYGVADFSSLK